MSTTTDGPVDDFEPERAAAQPTGPAYVRRPVGGTGAGRLDSQRTATPGDDLSGRQRLDLLGIDWDWSGVDITVMGESDGELAVERALTRFRAGLAVIIWDAARLEGNTFTLPEVQTLLDGVTVEGKKIEEQQQVLALNDAYNELDRLVQTGEFRLNKSVSDSLHGLVARYEAIESGRFRGEGSVRGGGSVRLSSGGVVEGRAHGDEGSLLVEAFHDLVDYLNSVDDPRRRALVYAASATRHQFYFDGNKRTAKLMASGILMSAGYDAISVPYSRLYEQNVALDRLFSTNDATSYMNLLADCAR
ncbi:hypothetical protein N1031_17865 [Herbiconiux moechotypicola]|uniref:Fido domain-containing protein n=1 Tax=Herbiconiux moechotypicola TaxID=637393 RepID=A0ABN3E3N6_9MICO|nr:hypothetical protein [Herbiconiux moechotypicola]MCS5731627.1 hypothetical protein [Herbiconiux moechotypicola]